MSENVDKNLEIKYKFLNFFRNNKFKIYIALGFILLALMTIIILDINSKRTNKLISEKYVLASLFLSSDQNEKATEIYKDIILKKNKFYSILALNTILEKKLVTDQNEILEYFKIVENLKISKEQKEIINFKKALYYLKISKEEQGNALLKKIANSESTLKFLAEEILSN